ncbi:ABC transporter ATP-binding protein [Marinomonas rhizomae]|uniref:ATP-binding cassette domain-containing protein n=1 Tax=Marinomonas rhizomae TaxID=491948 RepID=UPI000DEA957E|nr:ABC transporter ATP-binding protein [Marinomonas rhizomae]RNF73724.1 ABC transporter ATP-binding protein [Marinomonas rhizomae]
MRNGWKQYRRAFLLTKSYYPKILSYFIGVTLVLLTLALINSSVPILLRETANKLADKNMIMTVTLGTAAAYVICWTLAQALEWVKNIASAAILVRCDAAFYRGLYEHILKLSFVEFKKLDQGVVVADIQRSNSGFSALTHTLFWILVPTVIELLFVFCILANFINPIFAFFFIASISVLVSISVLLSREAKGIHQSIMESNNGVMSYFSERMRFAEEVKLNNAYSLEYKGFADKVEHFIDKVTVGNFRIGMLMLLQVLLVGILLMVSTLYVVKEVVLGQYSVGDFVMINGYVMQLTLRLALLASVLIELRNHIVLLNRAFYYLDMPTESQGSCAPDTNKEIAFELSSVSYKIEDRTIFKDINLCLIQGKTYVITGPSGAGKTTLLRMLCGLLYPDKGNVYAFGVDFKKIDKQAFFDRIAVVTQNPLLVAGSIADNVQYNADVALSNDEMNRIFTELSLDVYPNSNAVADRYVGFDAATVSGGEKQRIAIARALARRKETILLDEPTSALDSKTEEMAVNMLKEKTRTLIMITHRASLIARADYRIHLSGDGTISVSLVNSTIQRS